MNWQKKHMECLDLEWRASESISNEQRHVNSRRHQQHDDAATVIVIIVCIPSPSKAPKTLLARKAADSIANLQLPNEVPQEKERLSDMGSTFSMEANFHKSKSEHTQIYMIMQLD